MVERATYPHGKAALRLALSVSAALGLIPVASAQSGIVPTEVRFPVRDSIAVVADIYRGTAGADAPTILLFHQGGGSARGEYRNIAPRLLREGYNVIAADMRGGGDRFGAHNRVRPGAAGPFSYCDAQGEVDAAVNLARTRGFGGPLVLWGSSYSGALVLQVAARRSADVRAVLAFSPASGEPMRGCEPAPYVSWLARAGLPTLILRPRVELEDESRAAALESMRQDGASIYIADHGVHGSSMLDAERTGATTEPQWNAVLAFLRQALAPRPPTVGERAVSIPSDGWVLRGDLRLPDSTPAPLVVLLHKAAGDRTIYRDLAARLAAVGIGSLRVDLRGHGSSTNLGRFVPGQSGSLEGTERDIAAIWRVVQRTPGVDTTRLALVAGSYSSQAASLAAREVGFGRAHVALSPGDFSDDSFRAAAGSRASWLFVRSADERFVREWLDAKVRALAPAAELWVLPAGSAHATDLLAADSTLAPRLTEWLRRRLQVPATSAALAAAGARSPAVRYLANEGVLIEGRGGRVFIDAFFGDGLPDYAVVPAVLRDSLERALEGFGGPALVLTTHGHRDHFDPTALARYLGRNAGAVAVGPAEAAARLDSVAPRVHSRVRAVTPSDARPAAMDLGWVQLQALAIPHGPTTTVQHVAYLLVLDGTTFLHLGDAGSDPDGWPALGLPSRGVDVALVPYWYALDEGRFSALLAVTRARTVVLLHAARPAAERGYTQDHGGWATIGRDLRKRYPQVEIPASPGEAVELHD